MNIRDLNGQFIRGVWLVTDKDIRIYYTKPPVLIFGLLFPFFIFMAFYLGRDVDFNTIFPGLLAMFLFFIASSVGPLITPWEKMARTYERLLSFPVDINTIILGDTIAGMAFGIMINIVVLIVGLIFLNFSVKAVVLTAGLLLGAFCFSTLGVLLASPSLPNPSYIMMLSSLIRFPLIFISGIFIPLETLHGTGRVLSYFSPITYVVDIFNYSFKGVFYISPVIDFTALFVFSMIFIYLSNRFHRRNIMRGL
jgi:ABC-2 type transport system permease protein